MSFSMLFFYATCYLADCALALFTLWCNGLLNAYPLFESSCGWLLPVDPRCGFGRGDNSLILVSFSRKYVQQAVGAAGEL